MYEARNGSATDSSIPSSGEPARAPVGWENIERRARLCGALEPSGSLVRSRQGRDPKDPREAAVNSRKHHRIRVRENDKTRKTLSNGQREFMREIVAEVEARIDAGIKKATDIAGIKSADIHAEQHKLLGEVLPELVQTLLPWVREQHSVYRKKAEVWEAIKTDQAVWAARVVTTFLTLSIIGGGAYAIAHMLGR